MIYVEVVPEEIRRLRMMTTASDARDEGTGGCFVGGGRYPVADYDWRGSMGDETPEGPKEDSKYGVRLSGGRSS